jgi:hypothetical protein
MIRPLALTVLLVPLFFGCSSDSSDNGEAIFLLPAAGVTAGDAFFDSPWPSDLRLTAEGTIDILEWPNPLEVEILDLYFTALTERIHGYSTSGCAYMRFSDDIQASSLPENAAATLLDGASVFIVDVDVDSSTRGTRHPAEVHFRNEATTYWPSHTLAVRPVLGLPLAADRTYAVVVTNDLRQDTGVAFSASSDLQAILNGDPGSLAMMDAQAVYEPAIATLADMGVSTDSIISMTVFTTQDPVSELMTMRDWLVENYTAPEAVQADWQWVAEGDEADSGLAHIKGSFSPAPIFMHGEAPFQEMGSSAPYNGDIVFDDAGNPVVASEIDMRFTLTVPKTPMPVGGYPVVIYAHGTGGDWESVLGDTARDLAEFGFAALGFDQLHHGDRNPTTTDPSYLVFSPFNPYTFRENARQSALDLVQIARFLRTVEIPNTILSPQLGGLVHFDPESVYFYGHSQGGLNGPLFLAIDDLTQGGVLSGAGAGFLPALVDKVEPVSIPQIVMLGIGLSGTAPETEHLVYEHPINTLLQTWLEVADSSNYVHMMFDQPRAGFAPKIIFQTEGVNDLYTPPVSIEALSSAARIPLIEPMLQPIPAHSIIDLAPMSAPAANNVAGGTTTAGLMQFEGGHFVAFGDTEGRPYIRGFWNSIAEGAPQIGTAIPVQD